jgi:hypothetical protein
MLLARLVSVKPANPVGSEPRPAAAPTPSFDRVFKLLSAIFGRK